MSIFEIILIGVNLAMDARYLSARAFNEKVSGFMLLLQVAFSEYSGCHAGFRLAARIRIICLYR